MVCVADYQKKNVVNEVPNREKVKICILDDEGFISMDKLISLGYKNVEIKYQFNNIDEFVGFDVIFCDIQGIGHIQYPNNKGFDVAIELKKRYPCCNVFVYTGIDLTPYPQLPDNIKCISKQTPIKDIVSILDNECKYLWNPVEAWKRIEGELRKASMPNKYIASVENDFFSAYIDGDCFLSNGLAAQSDQYLSFENVKYYISTALMLIDVVLRFQGR